MKTMERTRQHFDYVEQPSYKLRRVGAFALLATLAFGVYKLAGPTVEALDKAIGTYACPTDNPDTYTVSLDEDAWGIAEDVTPLVGAEDPRSVYNAMQELSGSELKFITPGQVLEVPSHC
jgi:hypothetical protein